MVAVNYTKIIRWIIVILLAIIVLLGVFISIKIRPKTIIERDTITIVKIDTIRIAKPIYIKEKVIDTIFVPIKDTIRTNDTLYLQLPKTQKYYSKDSLYQAWVSGYRPTLDSINIFQKVIEKTIINTITKNPRRIGIGVMGGYGITFGEQTKLSPFIGVGLYYRIW